MTDSTDKAPLERLAGYAGRPSDWLHHSALARNRPASIDRLCPPEGRRSRHAFDESAPAALRATSAKWLEALIEGKEGDDAVQASMAAIQTASP